MPFKRAVQDAGLSYTGMRDAFFRGDIAIVRVGKAWYIEPAELARFIERQTEKQTR